MNNNLVKNKTYFLSSPNPGKLRDTLREFGCGSKFTVSEIKNCTTGYNIYTLISNNNTYYYCVKSGFISNKYRNFKNAVNISAFQAKFYEYNPDDDIPIE